MITIRGAVSRRRQLGLLLACAMAGVLGGCRAEEQGRPLEFEPGVYKGETPKPLDDRQRKDLRDRGALQG